MDQNDGGQVLVGDKGRGGGEGVWWRMLQRELLGDWWRIRVDSVEGWRSGKVEMG